MAAAEADRRQRPLLDQLQQQEARIQPLLGGGELSGIFSCNGEYFQLVLSKKYFLVLRNNIQN